jgi:co-chaperonin GroES (HSP10)
MDLSENGDNVKRNGIFIPTNSIRNTWRKGKVLLVGTDVKHTKVGDIVLFPHDRGLIVSNVEVSGYGRLKKGMFLNEQRLFGICLPNNESI